MRLSCEHIGPSSSSPGACTCSEYASENGAGMPGLSETPGNSGASQDVRLEPLQVQRKPTVRRVVALVICVHEKCLLIYIISLTCVCITTVFHLQSNPIQRNQDRLAARLAEERVPAHSWAKSNRPPPDESAATLKRLRLLNNDVEWVCW